ncbi:hypothetical protein UPYG_G00164950 [Umbra pygmaea]|uniref:Uncharacterized protein n=1 Tax=Umbra pygmaea TaxID=75934 RepID=A0ABD0X6C9_UMBPY
MAHPGMTYHSRGSPFYGGAGRGVGAAGVGAGGAAGVGAGRYLDADLPKRVGLLPTEITVKAPLRVLLPADGQALPLCYDIPAELSLRLLKDPNHELSMNGQLGEDSKGYQKIVLHYKK